LTHRLATITDRGFTGHEHLDEFRLINMGGRLFDPLTSRFLNSDPVIDSRGTAQGLNSYTYCLNNPLKYTDPTGYILDGPPEEITYQNTGWLRYAGGGHSSSSWFENQMMSGRGGGGSVRNPEGIYYDKESKSYRKLDGTILEGDELIEYLYSLFEETNGQGDESTPNNYNWGNFALNSANIFAYTIQTRQLPDLYSLGDVLGSKYLNKIAGVDKWCTRFAIGASVANGLLSVWTYSQLEDPTWGDKAKLTVGITSSVLSAIPITTYLGISIGATDMFGGFDEWYGAWSNAEKMYNNYGVAILPITYPWTFVPVTIEKSP